MSVDLRIRKSMVSGDRHFSLDVAFSSFFQAEDGIRDSVT